MKKKRRTKFKTPDQFLRDLAAKSRIHLLDLPEDVTRIILMKVGVMSIMKSAQFVCKSWYNLCKQPSMWRTICIEYMGGSYLQRLECEDVMMEAIDRSDGSLIVLNILGCGPDHLCSYLASRSLHLKSLRIARCNRIDHEDLRDALEKLSSLEELEITLCDDFEDETIVTLISCLSSSLITIFRFNQYYSNIPLIELHEDDRQARAIAGNMPELRQLQLIANHMTDAGLTAILDGCPRLQYLDLRGCYNVKLTGNLETRLNAQMNVFLRPDDPIDDDYAYKYNYSYTDWGEGLPCPCCCLSIDYDDFYWDDNDFYWDDELYEYDFTVV